MKKIIIPNSVNQVYDLINLYDGMILSLEHLSINAPYFFKKEEIINILNDDKFKNKEIFLSLNKNIHEYELDKLKDALITFKNYNIRGILYYDLSVVELNSKLDKKYNLIWAQEHLTTSLNACEFYKDFNVGGVLLSPELNISEMLHIKNNTKLKCMAYAFGYLPMFVSYRHTIKNYYDFGGFKNQSGIHFIEKEGKKYPIIDIEEGTMAYSNFILNGSYFYKELENMDYLIFNSLLIPDEKFKTVLENFENKDEIDKLFENTDIGFLDKETIYRVKKNG